MIRFAKIALSPVSGLYGLIVNRRDALYRRGMFHQHRVDAPVISVGNITIGGTGKTPLVKWIARELAGEKRRVCILTRGYRRRSKGQVLVSNGAEVLATVEEAGDEALMLAESLNGSAAVICDADRVAAARFAIERLGSNVLLLDDGFQHRRIARDLDIVIVDGTHPLDDERLLPLGHLREPLRALRRADCFVIPRADNADAVKPTSKLIAEINSSAPIFLSTTRLVRFRALASEETSAIELDDVALAAFCGIGNPQSFFSLLQREGLVITDKRVFRDHHRYTQADVSSIEEAAGKAGASALLTTAKDAVKLRHLQVGLPCYVAEINIEIQPAGEFRKIIAQTINQAKNRD